MGMRAAPAIEPVATGVRVIRMPLPYPPGWVNVYLVDDGDGGDMLIDTGIHDAAGIAAWEAALAGPLATERISGVLVTHWHNDHFGLAGWLHRRLDLPVFVNGPEYERGRRELDLDEAARAEREAAFLDRHGADANRVRAWLTDGYRHRSMISAVPDVVLPVPLEGEFAIGPRRFEVISVGGHSPASTTLLDRDGATYFCADQLSPLLIPNVSVLADAPESDPLAEYLGSTARITECVGDEVLVLPGHGEPFREVSAAVGRVGDHHSAALSRVLAAADVPVTAAELVPQLTRSDPGSVWYGYLIGRAIACAHYLVGRGLMERYDADPVRFLAPGRAPTLDRHELGLLG